MEKPNVKLMTESFEITKEEQEGVKMQGLALPFEKKSRNGVIYDKESIKQTADTLIGKPMLYNHDGHGYMPVGHIEDISIEDDGLYYQANIDPGEKNLVRKLKRGDISNVSVQVAINEEEVEGDKVKVEEFWELSIAPIPGYPETTTSIEKLIENKEKDTTGEPFAGFDDWNECIKHMKDEEGYDEDTAEKVCGMLKKYETEVSNMTDETDETEEQEQPEQEATEDLEERIEAIETEITNMKERIQSIETKLEAQEQEEEDDEEDEDEEEEKETAEVDPAELEKAKSKRTLSEDEDTEDSIKEALQKVMNGGD